MNAHPLFPCGENSGFQDGWMGKIAAAPLVVNARGFVSKGKKLFNFLLIKCIRTCFSLLSTFCHVLMLISFFVKLFVLIAFRPKDASQLFWSRFAKKLDFPVWSRVSVFDKYLGDTLINIFIQKSHWATLSCACAIASFLEGLLTDCLEQNMIDMSSLRVRESY